MIFKPDDDYCVTCSNKTEREAVFLSDESKNIIDFYNNISLFINVFGSNFHIKIEIIVEEINS